jgi:hypothetical protein
MSEEQLAEVARCPYDVTLDKTSAVRLDCPSPTRGWIGYALIVQPRGPACEMGASGVTYIVPRQAAIDALRRALDVLEGRLAP